MRFSLLVPFLAEPGAAGFPLLLKNIRANNDGDGAKISKSKIGSLVMLPYFRVGDSETSEIKSSAFEEKTKTAIRYYNPHPHQTEETGSHLLPGL